MGFQSPSAFSAIIPTSPNWPRKPLQWVLLGHWGPHHILLPISFLPSSGFHAPLSQSLPSPSVPLTSPSLGWALIHLELAPRWLNSAEESPQSAASIELKTGPPKRTAQSPSLYNNDGILLCFSQSLKPFFTSLSVANCVSCFTEKIKPIPLENPQHPSSNLESSQPSSCISVTTVQAGCPPPTGANRIPLLWLSPSLSPDFSVLASFSSHKHALLLLLFSCSVMSNSWRPHGLQHTRLPCPSPSPRVCSNSCPLSQWCHSTIPSSITPFSSCPESFPMSRLFALGSPSIGASASASVPPVNI